jgi:hypothetical protein
MFTDLSKRNANDYARLKSPLLPNIQCMTFYYHLYGHGGTLNLYMAEGDNLGAQLWTRTGSQGDIWRFGRMTTTKNNANIVFEGNYEKKQTNRNLFLHSLFFSYKAITGTDSMGDASIDDVIFTPGACKESASIGESCTFIDYLQCGFTQNNSVSTLKWITYSGSRAIPISYDHTTGTSLGSYIYIDLESEGENLNGRLYSPMYPSTMNQSYCMEFYYVLSGSNNTFNVYTESSSGTKRPIFTKNYDHDVIWNKGEATITTNNQFQIVFEIITGYLRKGEI